LKSLGCTFAMDDLTLSEWKGLEILEREIKLKEKEDMEKIRQGRR